MRQLRDVSRSACFPTQKPAKLQTLHTLQVFGVALRLPAPILQNGQGDQTDHDRSRLRATEPGSTPCPIGEPGFFVSRRHDAMRSRSQRDFADEVPQFCALVKAASNAGVSAMAKRVSGGRMITIGRGVIFDPAPIGGKMPANNFENGVAGGDCSLLIRPPSKHHPQTRTVSMTGFSPRALTRARDLQPRSRGPPTVASAH